jgi:hypothetical protein
LEVVEKSVLKRILKFYNFTLTLEDIVRVGVAMLGHKGFLWGFSTGVVSRYAHCAFAATQSLLLTLSGCLHASISALRLNLSKDENTVELGVTWECAQVWRHLGFMARAAA